MNVITGDGDMIGVVINPERAAAAVLGAETVNVEILEGYVTGSFKLDGGGNRIVVPVQLGSPLVFGAEGYWCIRCAGVGDDQEFTSGGTRINTIPDDDRISGFDDIGSLLKGEERL